MNNELRSQAPHMTLLHRIMTHDNSAPMSKSNTCATAEALIDVLGQELPICELLQQPSEHRQSAPEKWARQARR